MSEERECFELPNCKLGPVAVLPLLLFDRLESSLSSVLPLDLELDLARNVAESFLLRPRDTRLDSESSKTGLSPPVVSDGDGQDPTGRLPESAGMFMSTRGSV